MKVLDLIEANLSSDEIANRIMLSEVLTEGAHPKKMDSHGYVIKLTPSPNSYLKLTSSFQIDRLFNLKVNRKSVTSIIEMKSDLMIFSDNSIVWKILHFNEGKQSVVDNLVDGVFYISKTIQKFQIVNDSVSDLKVILLGNGRLF